MTLALLITAATGAWAQTETLLLTIESKDYADFRSGSMSFDDKVTVTFSDEVENDGDTDGWYRSGAGSLLTVAGTNGYTITSCKFYTKTGSYTIVGESPSVYLSQGFVYTDDSKSVLIGGAGVMKIEVFGAAASAPDDVEVITNAASEQDLFTTASFKMPTFDVDVNYELVRDMSIQMTATMGDGTDGVRYRVKKAQQGEGYEPAEMNMMQVLALVAVNDGIEHKDLTLNQDYYCRIYKLDEQTKQPEGDGVELYDFDFAPGLYALKAFAKDDSDYAGETALSNTFKLFQGYPVEIAAQEFITYYKDEPLYVEDEDAVLYTITSVNGDQAVLSDRSDAMPSNTPMLVYNKSNETKVILLIPCAEPDMDITVAPEFVGTLEATTIAASTDDQTNYAFNGKQFVWVKDAITVGANKAWLSINTGVPSARITLVFEEATGISLTPNPSPEGEGSVYDLNGRKLDKMPTKKGVYILNGKKVVIK